MDLRADGIEPRACGADRWMVRMLVVYDKGRELKTEG